MQIYPIEDSMTGKVEEMRKLLVVLRDFGRRLKDDKTRAGLPNLPNEAGLEEMLATPGGGDKVSWGVDSDALLCSSVG